MKQKFFLFLGWMLVPICAISQNQQDIQERNFEDVKKREIVAKAMEFIKMPSTTIVSDQLQKRVDNEFNIESNPATTQSVNSVKQ